MKTIAEQIAAVRRELAMREKCYPGWILRGKLTAEKAAHEIDCMKAVLETLTQAAERSEPRLV